MLISIVWRLRPLREAQLPPTLGRAIHGLFFSVIKEADPALAARLHPPQGSHGPVKFTTSPLRGPLVSRNGLIQLSPEREYWLRFTSLDRELSQLLLALPQEGKVTSPLLGVPFEIVKIEREPGPHRWASWVGRTDFLSLYEKWLVQCERPPERIGLEFCSPTTFQQGKLTAPFPMPRLVFLTLADKWNALSPVHLGTDINETIEEFLELRWYRLRTRSLRLPYTREPEIGFVGKCVYRLRPRAKEAELLLRIVNLLADFAFYAGVGGKTAMGMGQTRRIVLEQSQVGHLTKQAGMGYL